MVIIQKTAYAPAADSKSTNIANHAATVALARSVAPASLIIFFMLVHGWNCSRLPGTLRTGNGDRVTPGPILATIEADDDDSGERGSIGRYIAGSACSP